MDEFEEILARCGIDVFCIWGMEDLIIYDNDLEELTDAKTMEKIQPKPGRA
jgi:hypothetical protein